MKKHLLTTLLCIGAMLASNKQSTAQTLIHYWHFNNFDWSDTLANASTVSTITHPGIFGLDADYSIHDTSKAKILYALQSGVSSSWPDTSVYHVGFTYIDSYTGSTINAQFDSSAGNCLRTRNPSDSMELLFYIPTINYESIVLSYACERSTSGMLQHVFDFSSDSGVTWGTTGLSVTSDSIDNTTAFLMYSVSISDPSANNNSKLVFRIKFNGNNNTSNGNDRFDNVTVQGDSIGAPRTGIATINGNSTTYSLSPNPSSNSLYLNSNATGERNVLIYNSIGQTVFTETIYDKQTLINISNFNSGVYYMNIHENATGKTTTLPFVKQ